MTQPETSPAVCARLKSRAEIHDTLCRYARGVDRNDVELLRSVYHPDATDDHGSYSGSVDGFVEWLAARFICARNSMHFLGNCLIEFSDDDTAAVETYFQSVRVDDHRSAAGDAVRRESWGRYIDRFERRNGAWRIARRKVVVEGRRTDVIRGDEADSASTESRRDRDDPVYG